MVNAIPKPQPVKSRPIVKEEEQKEEKEQQVKTSYYALATGKPSPLEASKTAAGPSVKEDDEESEEDDDDDEDDHTFKTITEKPFEEDQVTTVQNSVSRAGVS